MEVPLIITIRLLWSSSSLLPFLLLIVSIPITVSISNFLPQQQAMAKNATTNTNSTSSAQQSKVDFLYKFYVWH
jgi:hypothetical protein